jgi:hypothetical protein
LWVRYISLGTKGVRVSVEAARSTKEGRAMTKKYLMVLAVAALTAVAGGCGDSDRGVITGPPADVAGNWLLTVMNPLRARYVDCTEDAVALDDATIWAVNGGVTCDYAGSLLATQSEGEFTLESVDYACSDGWSGSVSGGGTVDGNRITGHMDVISDHFGWTGTEYFSGSVSEGLIGLESSRVLWTGTLQGECAISPKLEYQGEIRDPE